MNYARKARPGPEPDRRSRRSIKSFVTRNSKLVTLLLLLTGARLGLIGKGTLALVDEQRYVTAMLGLRALGEGHGLEFLRALNSLGARPGDGLWRVLPGLGQAVLLLGFGLNPNAPPSLQVPQAFNVLIMGLNVLLLYGIYRQFFRPGWALLGAALYGSLVNTNLYLRHLLPYDHALFFFLLALWLLLTQNRKKPVYGPWVVGLLSGFSYAVYPGYFLGPAVLLGLGLLRAVGPRALAGAPPAPRWPRPGPVAAQAAGVGTVLLLLEGLSRAAGTSYLASSRYMATTITQGSFAEGFSFIGTYCWQVEGGWGLALLGLGGAGLLLRVGRLRADFALRGPGGTRPQLLTGLLLLGFLGWLGYAGAVFFAHKLVFYGRILHFFVPFIVLGALVALREIGRVARGQRWLLAGGGALALGHFGVFWAAYRAVDYPADVAYDHGIRDARQIAATPTTGCDSNLIFYRVFGPRLRGQPTDGRPRYRLVNFAYLYPVSCYRPLKLAAGPVVAAVPYFMKYPPYQFEGHDPAQRARLQNHPYAFEIIRADSAQAR